MKSVLIGIVGLPRDFKRTASTILSNLINPNLEKYNFSIIINTATCKDHIDNNYGRDIVRPQYNTDIEMEEDFKIAYGPYFKKCTYYTLTSHMLDTNTGVHGNHIFRINKILEDQESVHYDYYIMMRSDVRIEYPINMDNYKNTFSLINTFVCRSGSFFEEDWGIMMISDRNPFFLYHYYHNMYWKHFDPTCKDYYLSYKHPHELTHELILCEDIEQNNLSISMIEYIRQTYKLTGWYDSTIEYLYKGILSLMRNKYIFRPEQNCTISGHEFPTIRKY